MSNLVSHRHIFVEDGDFRLKRAPSFVIHEYYGGGGKTQSTTQSVTIPPEVLARYNSVNATAEQAAQIPFQQYSSDPSAFVAPVNSTQQAGIDNTNANSGAAQPYYGAATQLTAAGAGPTNVGQLSGQDIQQYMNPFINDVVNPTAQLLNQQQQAQMSGQTGNAIKSGAFGGDRAGIAAANLAGQQSLSFANAINPLYSQAYDKGLGTAQQQQGFNLGQQQANLGRLSQAGQQFGALGTGAQTAALQGAQSQLAAGQVAQQTEQAGRSALYNQFLQQQGYPFQRAQFLANIAEGTGALSGSTTTTTQPRGLLGNRGGLMRAAGGSVDVENEGQGYYAGGLSHGGYAEGGAPGLQIFGMPHQHSVNPGLAAALSAGVGGVRKLMRPSMAVPKAPASGLSEVSSLVSGGNDLASGLGKAGTTAQGLWNKVSPSQAPTESAHGGLVGYTGGGDIDPYHPDDRDGYMGPTIKAQSAAPRPQLLQAGAAPQKPDSAMKQIQGGVGAAKNIYGAGKGLSSLIMPDAAAGAADAAGLAGEGFGAAASGLPEWLMALGLPFGVQRGGSVRQGLAAGGMPEDSPPEADMPALGAAYANYEKPRNPTFAEVAAIAADEAKRQGLDPRVVTNVIRGEYGNGSKYVGDDGSSGGPLQLHYGNASSKYPHPGIGDEFTKQTGLDARDPSTYEASTRFGVQQMAKLGLTPWLNTMNKFGYAPDSAHTGQGGLGAISRAAPDQVAQNGAGPQPGLGAGASRNIAPKKTGLVGLFEDNKNWLIPLARGLGAAQQSHAIGLAGTLAAGIGGAGKAYAEQEQEQAGLGQTEANTGLAQAQTAGAMLDNARKGIFIDAQNNVRYMRADGKGWISAQEYRALPPDQRPPIIGGPAGAAAETVNPRGTAGPPASVAPPKVTPVAPVVAEPNTAPAPEPILASGPAFGAASKDAAVAENQGGTLYGEDLKNSGDYQRNVLTASKTSINTSKYTRELATALADINTGTGINVAGTQADARASLVNALNTMASGFGAKDKDGNAIRFGDLAKDTNIINKINILQGAMQAAGGDQRSFSALDALKSANPNAEMDPAASAKIVAQLMTDQVRARDREKHMFLYKDASGNSGYVRAQGAFAADNPQEKYDTLQAGLEQLISKSPKSYVDMTSRKYTYDQIRNKLKEGGYPPRIADIITGKI